MTTNLEVLRVLVVDDDHGVRTICDIALSRLERWTVFLSDGCDSALDILAKNEIDLVLLDVMMPRVDGLETLRRIRANPDTADIPVIFLTAKVDVPDLPRDANASNGTISKPFDPIELGGQIRELLGATGPRVPHEMVD